MVALASIPIFAVAPLLVFWFGVGLVGKVIVVGYVSGIHSAVINLSGCAKH